MAEIAKWTHRDSRSVRMATIIALIYLPANLVLVSYEIFFSCLTINAENYTEGQGFTIYSLTSIYRPSLAPCLWSMALRRQLKLVVPGGSLFMSNYGLQYCPYFCWSLVLLAPSGSWIIRERSLHLLRAKILSISVLRDQQKHVPRSSKAKIIRVHIPILILLAYLAGFSCAWASL